MRILLVGEYSRLHNTLKEGLLHLGHEVLLIGTGDGFKNFPVDIDHSAKVFSRSIFRPLVKIIERITSVNLVQLEHGWRFYKQRHKLKGFDVVQLINENSIRTHPPVEVWLLKKLLKQNDKFFLLSCGTDHTSVSYANEKRFRYSILTPLFENPALRKKYRFILKYLSKPYIRLHRFLYSKVVGVIATDMDYHLPLISNEKYLGMIPNPVNVDKVYNEPSQLDGPIRIFHGINSMNYIKKGNRFFEEALQILKEKHGKKIEITTAKDHAYSEYIDSYAECHILLDQVYAYDQGYNALEAMAKSKVVFTGAEKEWLDHYELEEDTVAINALPDTDQIVLKLEWLLNNPEKILEISGNARLFIEKEHHHLKIAQRYINTWQMSLNN